jgi:two-component system, NtrC family, response regulator AtoC
MPHALIVEDDVDAAMSHKALIVREAFSVAVANNLRDARREISLQQTDIVLLELQLADDEFRKPHQTGGSN